MPEKKSLPLILWIAIAFVVGGAAGVGTMLLINHSAKSASIALYPPTVRQAGRDWVVAIDDYAIPKVDYEEGYGLFMSQISQMVAQQQQPMPDAAYLKQMYLDNLINTYVVTIKALDDGLLDKPENVAILGAAMRDAISKIYLQSQFPADQMAFMPSKIEEDQYYQQNKDQFAKLGLSSDQIRAYIRQEVSQKKLQIWMDQVLSEVKSGYKVKRNNDVLGQLGVQSAIGGFGAPSSAGGLSLPPVSGGSQPQQ